METRFVDSIWITAMPGFERGGRERDEWCDAFVPLTDAELEFYRNWGRRRLCERGEEHHARFSGAGDAA